MHRATNVFCEMLIWFEMYARNLLHACLQMKISNQ